MKYLQVKKEGLLAFATMKKPIPLANECLIEVKAIGVNRADILQRQGMYPAPKGESEVLGLEVSGEIIALGSNVTQWQMGQRIFGLVAGGAYAQYVVINAGHIISLPDHFSFIQGAAIAETYLTAYQSLFLLGNLQANQKVLVHAGASGVGTAAIQLAKLKNCYVAATVSSAIKAKACENLGADKVVLYKAHNFEESFKQEKTKFNVIIDVVAADYVNKNISLCALDGKIIVLSMLGGRYVEQLDIAKMLLNRVQLIASTLRNQPVEYKTKLVNLFNRDFSSALKQGKITPLVDRVLSWKEADIAHQKMLNNENIGKLVLSVDND